MLWFPWAHRGPADPSPQDLARRIAAAGSAADIAALTARVAALEAQTPAPAGSGEAEAYHSLHIGRYIVPGVSGYSAATVQINPTQGALYYIPIYVPRRMRFDRIGCRTSATGGVGNRTRMGICTSVAGVPTTWLYRTANLATEANNTDYTETIDVTLTPGTYFLAFRNHSGASGSSFIVPTVAALGHITAHGRLMTSMANLSSALNQGIASIANTDLNDPPTAPNTNSTDSNLFMFLTRLRVLNLL